MTAAQEKILLETHGLAKETRGAMKGLVTEVKLNRSGISEANGKIREIEKAMVTKADCVGVQAAADERKRWSWTRGAKTIAILLTAFNLLIGSGFVFAITKLAAVATP